jgi:hypothetical protein
MTITQLESACPSAFATQPHPDVSSRYVFFDSRRVIEECYNRGFEATTILKRSGKDPQYGLHTIRFTQPHARSVVGDVVPQLVLTNSHNRTRRFMLKAGVFRLVCSNGLTVSHWGTDTSSVQRMHLEAQPEELVSTVLNGFDITWNVVSKMMRHELSPDQRRSVARAGLLAAHDDNTHYVDHIPLGGLLSARRDEDKPHDLWTTMNMVQEHCVRGGYELPTGRQAQQLREPTRVERVNTQLWNFCEGFIQNN